MICSRRSTSSLPDLATAPQHPYGVVFWKAYVANLLVMTALALLFRYADLISCLGGTEIDLGLIVGVGMLGSLLMRVFLAVGIDHHGPRDVWVGSAVVLALSCFAHVWITSCHGPAIYVLRIVMASSVAGVFGASMTFISERAVVERMAEMMGMLGTAGFLGIIIGTQLGDVLLATETIQFRQIERMFVVAGVLCSCGVLFAWIATRGQAVRAVRRNRPPLVWLLRRYHPGMVLLVGASMGLGLGLPGTFLRPYAAELDILRIGYFFSVYAPTAIVTRILTRRLPERIGVEPMILLGLGGLIGGLMLLLLVSSPWQLAISGVVYGMSPAVLFPSVTASGSRTFPTRYRGMGTMFILATYDVGMLVGAPLAGMIVRYSERLGLPGYPVMFTSVATVLGTVGILYGVEWRRKKRRANAEQTSDRPEPRRRDVPEVVGSMIDD